MERGSEGEDYSRFRAAHWAQALCACNDNRRVEIDRAGLGSRAPFAAARNNTGLALAERCQTVIARGAEFSGISAAPQQYRDQGQLRWTGLWPGGRPYFHARPPHIAAALGDHLGVLEASLDGRTAREIGAANGWGDGTAGERRAVRAQDNALAALASMEKKLAA